MCVDGEPAMVGRLALIDSWSLAAGPLTPILDAWRLVVEVRFFEGRVEVEAVELSESTRRAVVAERAAICIGGNPSGLGSMIGSSIDPGRVCEVCNVSQDSN